MAHYEIYVDRQLQYRWRLKARNGEIVATGESHPQKGNALRAIEWVQVNASTQRIIDLTR